MMRSKKRELFLFFLLFILLFEADFVLALEINYPPVFGVEPPQIFLEKIKNNEPGYEPEKALSLYIKYFYTLFLTVSGIVAFLAIVYGGFLYLFSVGSPARMKMAKNQITAGFTGLIVLLSSYLILTIINPQLAIFVIGKPEIEEPELPIIPAVEEGVPTYVEIPLGWLIERVKAKSQVARDQAEDVWYVGAEQSIPENTSLKELAECLNELRQECKCDRETEECEEYSPNGECPEGGCKEPCDRCVPSTICADIDASLANICSGILDSGDSLVSCPGPTECNLRLVINAKRAAFDLKTQQLWTERADAEIARIALRQDLKKLELAEALMRDAFYPPLNYHAFQALKEEERSKSGKIPEIKKLEGWEHIEPVRVSSTTSRDGISPPQSCRNYPPGLEHERTPSCIYCPCYPGECEGDMLSCEMFAHIGTDNPETPEIECETEQKILDSSGEISGGWKWFGPGDFPEGSQITYNGGTYTVPVGGVQVCIKICNGRCNQTEGGALSLGIPLRFPDDPATFYINEKENKDIIRIVEQSLAIIQGIGFGAPPGPGVPGTYCESLAPYLSNWEYNWGKLTPAQQTEHLAAIQAASDATGVRKALILALLSWESGFNQFPGSTYSYCCGQCLVDSQWKGYLGCHNGNCNSCDWCLDDPYGNCQAFDELWNVFNGPTNRFWESEYGFSTKDDVPLSLCGFYLGQQHCGGAMGLAQAMPFRWQGIWGASWDKKDPWKLEDAYLFATLHLQKSGGANARTCPAEIDAVWRYVGKKPEDLATAAHAACIVQLANHIAETETGEEVCTVVLSEGYLQVNCTESNPSGNPDLNPKLKGYDEVDEPKNLSSVGNHIDPLAPKLQTILGRRPEIKTVYALDSPSAWESQWPVHLAGFTTNSGEPVRVPRSGYQLTEGYEIVVIYAAEDALTIKYTEDDNVAGGYTIQFQNIQVDSEVLRKYRENEQCVGDKRVLTAYGEGDILGHADGDELIVAIRDTGAWMDPRWEDHWWQP